MFCIRTICCKPKLARPVTPINIIDEIQEEIEITTFEKDDSTREFISNAIMSNDFLRTFMDNEPLQLAIDSMYMLEYGENECIIREGEIGSHIFVSVEGIFEVIKAGVTVKKFTGRETFGELAILYNDRRAATVKTVTSAKVWVLDRMVFNHILNIWNKKEEEENIRFLGSVPHLQGLHSSVLIRICDLLKKEFFRTGTVIVRQGEKGDKFFIIRVGSVTISRHAEGETEERIIGSLSHGQFFGELALLREDKRQASIIAQAPGVECLTLDVRAFKAYLGDILRNKVYEENESLMNLQRSREFSHIRLKDLQVITTISMNEFGYIDLVQYKLDRSLTFLLKSLKKHLIVQQKRQKRIFDEKNIMFSCNNGFICRLYQTFRDDKFVYFMTEACMGGDVRHILDKRDLNENEAKFITACVVEAFEYLHRRGMIYRNLMPESVLLDYRGYAKLSNFNHAKRIINDKTMTFIKNGSYLAPEMIIHKGKGYDKAVDYWNLGIFIYEILSGQQPFTDMNQSEVYKKILLGINNVHFPSTVTGARQSIIKKLCKNEPIERLGCQKEGIVGIKMHRWFHKFDWESLRNGELASPCIKPIKGPTDTMNFTTYQKSNILPPDEKSGWDKDF